MTAAQPQVPVTVRTFVHGFSPTRRGARLARLLAAHQLTDWGLARGGRGFDAVVLVVAELAANGAVHGRVPGRHCVLRLAYDTDSRTVRVEVADPHHARPACGKPAPEDDHGRGLLMVGAVAARWGVQERPGPGKVVWAEVAVPAEEA